MPEFGRFPGPWEWLLRQAVGGSRAGASSAVVAAAIEAAYLAAPIHVDLDMPPWCSWGDIGLPALLEAIEPPASSRISSASRGPISGADGDLVFTGRALARPSEVFNAEAALSACQSLAWNWEGYEVAQRSLFLKCGAHASWDTVLGRVPPPSSTSEGRQRKRPHELSYP